MAISGIPGVENIDDIVKAFKAKGPWLNRFDSIIEAMVRVKDIQPETTKNEVLDLLKEALQKHLAKEKLTASDTG